LLDKEIPLKKRKSRCKDDTDEDDEEDVEDEKSIKVRASLPPRLVLPGLQRLRVICSSGTGSGSDSEGGTNASSEIGKKRQKHTNLAAEAPSRNISDIMADSSKLLVSEGSCV
jgi:hypothetical protein